MIQKINFLNHIWRIWSYNVPSYIWIELIIKDAKKCSLYFVVVDILNDLHYKVGYRRPLDSSKSFKYNTRPIIYCTKLVLHNCIYIKIFMHINAKYREDLIVLWLEMHLWILKRKFFNFVLSQDAMTNDINIFLNFF